MNKLIFIYVLLLINCIRIFAGDMSGDAAGNKTKKKNQYIFNSNLEYGWNYNKPRFFSQESIEWSTMIGVGVTDFVLFHKYLTPQDKNIFPGLDTSRPLNQEILPAWLGLTGIGVVGSLILFLPNNAGFLNFEAYNNTKGYMEAVLFTTLMVDILKFSFAEKRPNYQARLATGDKNTINDGMRSFPSEHAAVSFATSTYLTFFLFQYLGDNRIPAVLGLKCLLATGINSMSFIISALRVIENEHHIQDVVVGGVIGVLISSFFYCLQNYFGIYKKKKKDKFTLDIEPDKYELGLDIVLRY